MNIAVVNFNGGEFSPKIDARSDTEKYGGGCRKLENMIPSVFGGAERRPGTERISRDASLRTMLEDIIAHENVGVCYDNTVVNTAYNTFLSQIICHENDIICHENDIVFEIVLSRASMVVCHANNVVFYENELVTYE